MRTVLSFRLESWPPSPLINKCCRTGTGVASGTKGSSTKLRSSNGPKIHLVGAIEDPDFGLGCTAGGRAGKLIEVDRLFFRGTGDS